MTFHVSRSTFHVLGFTLIELMIAVSIFLVITMITLLSFRVGEKAEQLRFTIENVTQELRTIQVSARTGQRQGSMVPRGGFGLSIPPCDGKAAQCLLTPFGDQNSDRMFSTGEDFGEVLKLDKRISIDALTVKNAGLTTTIPGVTLIARSPYGDFQVTDITGHEIAAQELSIKFRQLDLDRTRTLIINIPSGQLRRE